MGIMDQFRTAPATPAAPLPGNIPAEAATATATATPGTAASGTIPATDPTKPASPLDAFDKLWETVATDPNAGTASFFNVKLEDLNKAAEAQSFTEALTPEMMAAVATGGEPAVKAFMASMNKVAQATYAKNALATTKIVERALQKQEELFAANLPGLIKKHQLSDTLRTENPAFSHPAAQPIIQALQSQLTVKYPNATATELRDMATQYLTAFSGVATAPATAAAAATAEKAGKGEIDWSSFLS